jgi:hypothetical protein
MAESGMKTLRATVGLDGIFRETPVEAEVGRISYFARGQWKDEKTFAVEVKNGWCLTENMTFSFDDERNLSFSNRALFYRFSLDGVVQ